MSRRPATPMPPYKSPNHMGMCGMINVFVANFENLPAGLDPNSAQFIKPSYTYLSPVDDRSASNDAAGEYSLRFSGRREPLRGKHLADLPECEWRKLLPVRSKLQPQVGRRKLRSDVSKIDGAVLHARRRKYLSVTKVPIETQGNLINLPINRDCRSR